MKLTGDDYIEAAEERLAAASGMFHQRRFVDSLYLSGVAVECVLRGFADEGAEFDGRHDLRRLLSTSVLERFVGEKQRTTMSVALGEVWSRWKNNYRYVAGPRLKVELKRLLLDRSIKGDALKANARVALENATTIVNKGAYQWKNK